MVKKIIILSDGTGNAASSVWRTNVWRIFESLNLAAADQAAKYDDGVGTSTLKPLALLGGIFGWGLKRNVIDCYKFVCRNYEPGSQLFFFGFSRGAFTVRVISALILNQGLVQGRTESELHAGALRAYRAYRASRYKSILRLEAPMRKLRDGLINRPRRLKPKSARENIPVPSIEFIGLWDTVAAYGMPIEEMTRGINDWIWPLELPDRELSKRVRYARHALALDDERTTFHPVLWTETSEQKRPDAEGKRWIKDERISQVWFAGMHANVGGGYPDDALAYVPLQWIFEEARRLGLQFKSAPSTSPDTARRIASMRDKDGRMYDSRAGLGVYYRYGPRDVAALIRSRPLLARKMLVDIDMPKIHHSVFGRIDEGRNGYAPIGLPARYEVVDPSGEIVSSDAFGFESAEQIGRRLAEQNRVWNLVWLRRAVYFATVAVTLYLLIGLPIERGEVQHEFNSYVRWVSEALRACQSFLPGALRWWFDPWARQPEHFLAALLGIGVLLFLNSKLRSGIEDAMHIVWATRGNESPIKNGLLQGAITWLRHSRPYRWLVQFLKRYLVPFAFALCMLWLGIGLLSHIAFNIFDSAGAFCQGTPQDRVRAVTPDIEQEATATFTTSDLCFATGLSVKAGHKYEITLRDAVDWRDGGIATTPNGYLITDQPWFRQLYLRPLYPLRRLLFRRNFKLTARIGTRGNDEYFLDLDRFREPTQNEAGANGYRDAFDARRSGEVFLYVNEAVLPLPWLDRLFYANNAGSAAISLKVIE